jgi:hypothetical protein
MTAIVDTPFISGTVISSEWLNGINDAINNVTQEITGSTPRLLPNKLADTVSVKDFGAVGDGITDDTDAFNSAGLFASEIVKAGTANNDIVAASVFIPAGIYKITAPILIRNCVQWYGSGSGTTCLLVSGSGVNGFEVDDVSPPTGVDYSNVRFVGFTLENDTSAQDGFVISGLIRNCGANDVVIKNFRDSWSIQETWQFCIENCASYNATRHHINAGSGVGEIQIIGGRYDVAASYGVYINDPVAELVIEKAAVQFGSSAAVRVDDARTVELYGCFFEGNCIGNPATYYIDLRRSGSNSLSSAVIEDCVMNDLNDVNRTGLGACYVEGFRSFKYRERWSRNSVTPVPIVGVGVEQVNATYNSANSRSALLTNLGVGESDNAIVHHTARPIGIFGQDMADISFAPTTRAALNVGFDTIGVAIGTHSSIGTVQAYGASDRLDLNPANGEIRFGQTGLASVADNSNEFRGRFSLITQITSSNLTPSATTGLCMVDTTSGNRSVTLTNISHLAGRMVTVVKRDGGGNTLTVNPGSGLINGAATWSSAAAYASVALVSDGTNWFII